MLARRGATWTVLAGAVLITPGACTGVKNDQPAVAARPGATQEGGKGSPVDEDATCARIRKSEEDKRRSLNCPDLERPRCPDYVRPAGGGCWTYAEESVSACEAKIGSYVACADFDDQPCIVTATPADAELCGEGSPGEGGAAGMPNSAGRGGGGAGSGGRGGTSAGPGGESGMGGESGIGGTP
jgi:hypothetical protein